MRRYRLLLQTTVTLLAMGILADAASAHRALPLSPNDRRAAYPQGPYPVGEDNVPWWFESKFPGSRNGDSPQKRAVLRATQAWNARPQRLTFNDTGFKEVAYDAPYRQVRGTGEGRGRYCAATRGADNKPLSLVFWEPLPGRGDTITLGEATTCTHAHSAGEPFHPYKFFVAMNRTVRWYTGQSNNVPGAAGTADARQDMQSTAMHEFGHAGGWLPHYDGRGGIGTARCGGRDPNRETMCSLLTSGTPWARTLGQHDLHTFAAAYQ